MASLPGKTANDRKNSFPRDTSGSRHHGGPIGSLSETPRTITSIIVLRGLRGPQLGTRKVTRTDDARFSSLENLASLDLAIFADVACYFI